MAAGRAPAGHTCTPGVTDGLLVLLGPAELRSLLGETGTDVIRAVVIGEGPKGGRGVCSPPVLAQPRAGLGTPRGLQVPGIVVMVAVAGADQTQLSSHSSVLVREGIPTEARTAPEGNPLIKLTAP